MDADAGMVIATFDLTLSYGTIAVFDPDLEAPFNDVTSAHSAQGFSWRPGSISFFTHGSCDAVAVEVWAGDSLAPRPDAARAIRVPFTVPPSRRVEISDLGVGHVIELPPGKYALLFEVGALPPVDNEEAQWWARCWCWLTFSTHEDATPAILVANDGLDPSDQLLMDAKPA